MRDAAIEVHDLSIHTARDSGRLALVEEVDFDVAPGEVCGIVGESGAGKTLTVRAVLGLLPPGVAAEGEISVGGKEAALREGGEHAGVVLQNPASMLDPLMLVGRQLTEAVVYHKALRRPEATERATRLLSDLGFEDPGSILKLYPHQLSGGMAQRAALAMALMPDPGVLIVDEPTSALDANLRLEVLHLVRSMAEKQGCAIILVSHDLTSVGKYCDSIVVMYAGRLVEAGPARDVLADPQHPYTEALLGSAATSASAPRQPLPVIPGSTPRPGERPAGCVFAPRCAKVFSTCRERQPPTYDSDDRRAACFLAFGRETEANE